MSDNRVQITPMPAGIRNIPKKWRPQHPPIFPYGAPSNQDIALARELIRELDEESQNWYATPDNPLFGDLL